MKGTLAVPLTDPLRNVAGCSSEETVSPVAGP